MQSVSGNPGSIGHRKHRQGGTGKHRIRKAAHGSLCYMNAAENERVRLRERKRQRMYATVADLMKARD